LYPLRAIDRDRLLIACAGAAASAPGSEGAPRTSLGDLKDVIVQGLSSGVAYEACWGLASLAMGGSLLLQPAAAPAWMPWALKGSGAVCSVAAGWATRHYLMK